MILPSLLGFASFHDHQVWLGETSSAWGGGAPGLSDTWVIFTIAAIIINIAMYNGHNYWWHVQFTSSSSLCLLMVTLINGINQVGCYCWLDKLGMAARYRVTTVIRQAGVFCLYVVSLVLYYIIQSLYHGHYALLSPSLSPRPDYW